MTSHSSRRCRVGACLGVLVAALPCGAVVRAHEIGTTRVAVLFQEGRTYGIEIVTDAEALVDKLEAKAGRSPIAETRPARLQSLLTSLDGTFRQRVKVEFGEAEARPEIAYSVAPGSDDMSAPVATVRLTGPIPPGARHFAWTYAWTSSSYAMAVRNAPSENPVTEWLEGGQRSAPIALALAAPAVDRLDTAARYLALGFTHIVPHGLDHMLFVLGIYLLSNRARSVLLQVSAFTVAHSITLGLSLYGLVSVSPSIVEPLIALSIVYVAVENVLLSELRSWRVALVFAFGLLHGMGFAGALEDLGLEHSEFLTALLTFNLGVEAGQLAVIGAAFVLVGWPCAGRVWYRSRVVVPASALIASTAVFWTIERLFP